MRWPSLETNHLRVSHSWYSASARSAPCSRIVAVARTSRSPLSASDTANGSMRHSLAHAADDGLARRRARWPGGRPSALASAICRGPPAGVGDGTRRPRSGTAKNPQPEPTRARTPMPGVGVLGDRLDLAVARRHRLVPAMHHPGVGVHRAGVDRRLHRPFGGLELAHRPSLARRRRSCTPTGRGAPSADSWARCTLGAGGQPRERSGGEPQWGIGASTRRRP